MTLLQLWTRRYIKVTQPLGSPQNRARMHEFLCSKTDNLHSLLATDAVPALLHLSVFLFFAGLLILLRHIDHTVFKAVVPWVAICVAVYISITILPIIKPASPHYAPLLSFAWQLFVHLLLALRLLTKKDINNADPYRPYHPSRLLNRLKGKVDEIATKDLPKLDAHILNSLINNLGEDGAREEFFEAIPGFCRSKSANDPRLEIFKKHLPSEFFDKFRRSVHQFLDETLSSDSVSESTRSRRLLSCLNATHILLGERASMSITAQIINSDNWTEVSPSPEIGRILKRWRNTTSSDDSLKVITGSCIIARIIAGVTKHGDTWKALARSHLEVTGRDLEDYLENGDNVLMANLIKTTRLFFEHKLNFWGILRPISEFRVEGTLPKLQQEFCTLWNEIVETSSSDSESSDVFTFILEEIRPVYDALHPVTSPQDTASGSTAANGDSEHHGPPYPLCPDAKRPHLPNSTRQTLSPNVVPDTRRFSLPSPAPRETP